MIQLLTHIRLSNRKSWFLFAIFVLFVLSIIPFDLDISPERRFKVVDENGAPIPNARIQQIWYQYSLRYSDEERLLSDSNGLVLLRRRDVKTRLLDLLSGAIGKVAENAIHASISSSDSVFVLAYGYAPKSFFDGEGLRDTVVLKKQ